MRGPNRRRLFSTAALQVAAVLLLAGSAGLCRGLAVERADVKSSETRRDTPDAAEGSIDDRSSSPDQEASWPRFRGPDGLGISHATGVPLEWSADRNVAWKTALPGPGASSPIVHGERIYVTCYTGYLVPGQPGGSLEQLKRHLIALRTDNGEILWDRAVGARLPEENRIREHGYAASTPAADTERVYVFFGKGGVIAYDHEGRQRWQADVGTKTSGWGSAASLVLYEDLVFVNASVESESLLALDRRTGEVRWRAGGIRESWNTPVLVPVANGKAELVLAVFGKLLSFDPASGNLLWSCRTDIGWYMVPSVVAHKGIVYCIGGRSGGSLAVRAGGRGDVTESHRLWTARYGSNVSSPIFDQGHLYWMHENTGVAYCLKADTGDTVYEERIAGAGQVYASPILADGRLYYVTRNGRTLVLAARPRFELLTSNELGDRERFDGSPALAGRRLLLRSDRHLYCIGEPLHQATNPVY